MTIELLGTGYCLPKKVVPNSYFEEILDTTDEWIVQRTGIRERRFCEEETLFSLAANAVRSAMENAGVSKVDGIIASSATFDYHFPPLASRVATELNLETPFTFDIGATCSGFVYGFDIAAHYLNADTVKTIAVVSAEVFNPVIDFKDRTTCILFGDAAAAAIVSKGGKPYTSFLGFTPDKEKSLYCPIGGKMTMNGSGVYKFAVGTASRIIKDILKKTNNTIDTIDWFILHQANLRILEGIINRLGLPSEKVPITIEKFANPSSAAIPLTLAHMREDGRLKQGQRVLLCGFGAGLTYGVSILDI